jgi:myosin-5
LAFIQAYDARDALGKDLYGRLFDWIVARLNKEMAAASPPSGGTNIVGILDIFGFEIFKVNSFEQFCINFCNEKLQNHFNETTFKNEEITYIEEQVEFTKVEYIDNQDVLDLIEGKVGFFCFV